MCLGAKVFTKLWKASNCDVWYVFDNLVIVLHKFLSVINFVSFSLTVVSKL